MIKKIYKLEEINDFSLQINKGNKVFIYGDLGAGKTTLVSVLLKRLLNIAGRVQSPTYIHYKKYLENIYHFDLYRLEKYEDFVNIGGEEIFDAEENISFIEWPEILEPYYKPDITIKINKIEGDEDSREIILTYY